MSFAVALRAPMPEYIERQHRLLGPKKGLAAWALVVGSSLLPWKGAMCLMFEVHFGHENWNMVTNSFPECMMQAAHNTRQ